MSETSAKKLLREIYGGPSESQRVLVSNEFYCTPEKPTFAEQAAEKVFGEPKKEQPRPRGR